MVKLARKLAARVSSRLTGDARDNSFFEAIRVLSDISAANFFATQSGGGEVGVTTGFGAIVAARQHELTAITQSMLHNIGLVPTSTGWFLQLNGGVGVRVGVLNTVPQNNFSATYTLTSTDVGKIFLFGLHFTGTQQLLYVNREQYGAAGNTVGTYAPAVNGATTIGQFNNSQGYTSGGVLAWLTFRGNPNAAAFAALADGARILGDLPEELAGANVTHHWSLKRALAGQYVTDRQAAPSSIRDNRTLAAADAATKQGSPVVREIGPGIDGRKTYGAQGFSATSFLKTANGAGIRGSAAGFWLHFYGRISFATGAAVIAAAGDGWDGWQAYTSSSSGTATFQVKNGATPFSLSSAAGTVPTTDIGTVQQFQFVYDGTKIDIYYKRTLIVSAAVSGYVLTPAYPMTVGVRSDGSLPGTDKSFFALQGGDGVVPTLAELQAAYDATEARGALTPIPGKTQHRWDIGADIVANGGPEAGVPAVVLDRIGADHLTRVGTDLTVAQRVERAYAWEASPIQYGTGGLSTTAYWQSAVDAGIRGQTGGLFWVGAPFVVLTQSVSSAVRLICGHRDGSNSGYRFYTSGTNSAVAAAAISSVPGEVIAGVSPISAADVGRVLIPILIHDGAKVTLVLRRAAVGGGAAITGYTVPSGQRQTIGDNLVSSDGLLSLGYFGGLGVISLAEAFAAHDAYLAGDELAAVPGKTDVLVRFTDAARANNGALPASVAAVIGNGGLSKVGAPTTAARYSRAYGW